MHNTIVEKIKKEVERFTSEAKLERVGTISSVGDGIAEIDGLAGAVMSEMVLFEHLEGRSIEEALMDQSAIFGLILNLEEERVMAIVLGDSTKLKEGMPVRSLGKVLSIPVGEELVGRVIDPLGKALDGKGAIRTKIEYPIEREAYGVIDRQSVNSPVHTGIKAVDAMIPIGRGQRELIIGDRGVGKTTLAIDTILNQRNEGNGRPVCIYVAIGQKESKTARIVSMLTERGAMDYTIVISAGAAAPAALQFLAPYAGAAVGEYFMEKGKDALVVFDDLSKQATAYRQLSLLLRRPPGREAYPGDIFYLHSRLLERSAKLSKEKGGGSLTALPIIETQEGDVSAYIPTNVISITDGQIYLESDLFNKGVRPAINVGISVSRVGSSAQTKAMKKVAGKLRLELAQFRELEAFMQFSQDLDSATRERLERGTRLAAILNQGKNVPVSFELQVPLLYAAVNGHLGKVPLAKIPEFETVFLEFLKREHSALIEKLKTSRELTPESETEFGKAIEAFLTRHPQLTT